MPLFRKEVDYGAFERVVEEAYKREPLRILAYSAMPNPSHWVVWPETDGQVSAFFRWLTVTHTQRWYAHYHTSGTGQLYQGRFKSFPVETDEPRYAVLRYVERNPVRAELVPRAEAWRWSSVWRFYHGDAAARAALHVADLTSARLADSGESRGDPGGVGRFAAPCSVVSRSAVTCGANRSSAS